MNIFSNILKYFFIICLIVYFTLIGIVWNHIFEVRKKSQHYINCIYDFNNENKDTVKTIFIGDSNVERYPLMSHFDSKMLNMGISGDMTSGVIDRLDLLIERKPKQVLLLIGTNDIARGISQSEIIDNYKIIYQKIKDSLPDCKLYTISVLPLATKYSIRTFMVNLSYSISFVRPYNMNKEIELLNNDIEFLTAKYNYTYINAYPKFINQGVENYQTDLLLDNVHPSEKGYQLLTSLILKHRF